MGSGISRLRFEDWVSFIFDHPAEGPQWYVDVNAPFWNGPAEVTCEYVTLLFEEPVPALKDYHDAELACSSSLHLGSNGCPAEIGSSSLALDSRRR